LLADHICTCTQPTACSLPISQILSVFGKLQKVTIQLHHVRMSKWNKWAQAERIFINFYIWDYNLLKNFKFGYLTKRKITLHLDLQKFMKISL